MWEIKKFRTSEAMKRFIDTHHIEYVEVFINQAKPTDPGYAIEYRKLRII